MLFEEKLPKHATFSICFVPFIIVLMNFSFSSLILKNVIDSPLISTSTNRPHFTFQKSIFSKFSFPSFYIQTNLKTTHSRFNNFISPVLVSTIEYIYRSGSFTSPQIFEQLNAIQFDCCSFSQINSADSSAIRVSYEDTTFALRFGTFSEITTATGCIFLNCLSSRVIFSQIEKSTSPIGSFINCNSSASNALISISSTTFVGEDQTQTTAGSSQRDALSLIAPQIVINGLNSTGNKINGWGGAAGLRPFSYISFRNNIIDNSKGTCVFWCTFNKKSVIQSFFNTIFNEVTGDNSIFWTNSDLIFESSFFKPSTGNSLIFTASDNSGHYSLTDCILTTSLTSSESSIVTLTNTQTNAEISEISSITFQLLANCRAITRSLTPSPIPPTPTPSPHPTPRETPQPSPTLRPTDRTKARTPARTPAISPFQSPEPTPARSPSPSQSPSISASPWPSPRYVPLFGTTAVVSFIICVVVFIIICVYKTLFEKSSSSTIKEREPPFKFKKMRSSSDWDDNYLNLSSDPGSDFY